MISTRRRMPEREVDKPIRRRVLGEMGAMDLDVVEVEDGKAAVEIEAVVEAVVMVEGVVAAMVVAEEVRISNVIAAEKKAIYARSARKGTASATSASRRDTSSRCVKETSQGMAETEGEAPVVDTVDMVEALRIRKPGSSTRCTARL